jgi:iron(III) transport system substrate-binding protein
MLSGLGLRLVFSTALVAVGVGAGAARAQDDLDALPPAELAERAKQEGQVVVYAFTSRIARVEQAFEAAYPGIDLVPFAMSSTQQIARLKFESGAGIANAGVAYISDAPVVQEELVTPGILQNYIPPDFKDRVPMEHQEPLLANRLSTKVLMYNEEAHPDGAPVRNLWELTLPEWRGRVVMVDPLVRGDYLDLMAEIVAQDEAMASAYEAQVGKPIKHEDGVESAGEQWLADLFANGVVLVSNTDAVNDAVGKKGQANPPVGFTTYPDRRDNEEEGRALQIANEVEPAPGILFPASLAVVKDAPHPAAARLLIHFMMGDDSPTGGDAFQPFYVAGDYATRTDIEPHPDAIPLDELRAWPIDPERLVEIQDVADLILTLQ